MNVELSRLEIKDIIANLGPDAEPEVRAKLEAAIVQSIDRRPGLDMYGQPYHRTLALDRLVADDVPRTYALRVDASPEDHASARRLLESPVQATDDVWRDLTRADFLAERVHIETGAREYTVSDDDIATINSTRRTSHEAAVRAAKAREGHRLIDFAETPAKPPAPRVEVGVKNGHGDTCVHINGLGQSVFQCARNGHGYVEEGSVTSGCPQCFSGGGSGIGSRQQGQTATMDDEDPTVETF